MLTNPDAIKQALRLIAPAVAQITLDRITERDYTQVLLRLNGAVRVIAVRDLKIVESKTYQSIEDI